MWNACFPDGMLPNPTERNLQLSYTQSTTCLTVSLVHRKQGASIRSYGAEDITQLIHATADVRIHEMDSLKNCSLSIKPQSAAFKKPPSHPDFE
jgi:hypothetical protein